MPGGPRVRKPRRCPSVFDLHLTRPTVSDPQPTARKTGLLIGLFAVLAFVFLAVTMVGACNDEADIEDRIAPESGSALVVPLLDVA